MKFQKLKEAMLSFDHEVLAREQEEHSLLDQLVAENAHLRKLLKIEDSIDRDQIGERIKALEERVGGDSR
jgi:hypothetical protein